MKISANNQSQVQSKPLTTSESSSTSGAKRIEKADLSKADAAKKAGVGDVKAQISEKAKEFAKAKEVATSAPDIREQKIADLKSRIASGKYEVNAQAIADRLVDEHVATGVGMGMSEGR